MKNTRDRVLVLGGNGFIGSHIVNSLIRNDYRVRVFDRFKDLSETQFNGRKNIEVVSGDFLNEDDIGESLDDVDYVIHAISTTDPVISENNPLFDIETNVKGSVELFSQIVNSGGVKRVVFLSSGGTVYGDNHYGRPINELDPTWPISPYGIGKLTIENYLHYFDKKYGQKYSVFRISNIYGEGQAKIKKQGIIPIFSNKIRNGEDVTVYGDGSMVRDYIYVKDVADLIAISLSKQLEHSVYNLGSGVGHSVNKIISVIESVAGKKASIVHRATPSTYVESSILDISRIKKEFPNMKLTDIGDGIAKVYKSECASER